MFTSDAGRREAWRRARECALGACALWLLVQNLVLGTVLLAGRVGMPWLHVAGALAVALAIVAPLWLVSMGALFMGLRAMRAHARREHGDCRAPGVTT